jgi:hypothetical protein
VGAFVECSKIVEVEHEGKPCEAPDVSADSAALGWTGLCRILRAVQHLVIGFLRSKPFHICAKQRRSENAKTQNGKSDKILSFFLSSHNNFLPNFSTFHIFYALNDLLPSDPVNNMMIEWLQSPSGNMLLKKRNPVGDIGCNLCSIPLVGAAEMAKICSVLVDRRWC